MRNLTPQLSHWLAIAVFGISLPCITYGQARPTEPQPDTSHQRSLPKPKEVVQERTDKDSSDDEILVLSPFEVNAEKDTGYQATETLNGTRIRTDLKDVGSAISIYTKDFLNDIGATDNLSLLQYTTNSEVGGTQGTYVGVGQSVTLDETANQRNPMTNDRVRGLSSADNTRDFVVSDIPTNFYNVGRVELQRGPNSILYGLGSPAGIINSALNSAEFRNFGRVQNRLGSYGSMTNSIDLNQQLIPQVLAIRIDGLWDDAKYRQKPAYQNDHRIYGTLRFDPKLFKDPSFHTSIKVKFEHGNVDANRPRTLTPYDSITPWFRPVDNTSIDGGMGKLPVLNPYQIGNATIPAQFSGWLTGEQANVRMIDGTTNELYKFIGGIIQNGSRNADGTLRASTVGLINMRNSNPFISLGSLNTFATTNSLPNYLFGAYRNRSLQDPTIFDFYNNLIDGSTKSEFGHWNTYNIDFSQTAFSDRLGFNVTFDRQKNIRGGQTLLSGSPSINIDVNENFQDYFTVPGADGTTSITNPNFGRAFVRSGSGSGNSFQSDRQNRRGSLFAELRPSDLTKNPFLLKLLGKQRFNGVYGNEKLATESRSWQMYAPSQDWAGFVSQTDGSSSAFYSNPGAAMIYLGSSLADASSASGANIPRITAPVAFQSAGVRVFDSTWQNFSVPFNQAWTVPQTLTPLFSSTTQVQASNPANYVGWRDFQMNELSYGNGSDPRLLTGAQKSFRDTTSYSSSWQGYFWNDAIVPTLGWRYDVVKAKYAQALPVTNNRSMLNLDPDVYALPANYTPDHILKDHSTSGGLVMHLNKLLGRHDVLPINVSLSYNKSSNFQVGDPRIDIYGKVVPNPTGSTKDYGILLSTKDGKYSVRLLKYDSMVNNASTNLSLGGIGSSVAQGMRWRNVFLYQLSAYEWNTRESGASRSIWSPAYYDSTGKVVSATAGAGLTLQTAAEAAAMRDASINAWNQIQKDLQAAGFMTTWGLTPTTQSALTDRATYAATLGPNTELVGTKLVPAQNNSQFLPDPTTVSAYSSITPPGAAVTANAESKGYEFEVTANPLKNWRISLNASETTAIQSHVGGPVLENFVAYMDQQMAGPAGDMRQFSGTYSATQSLRLQQWAAWRSNYALLKLQEGRPSPELSKWRLNVTTNYTFIRWFLKDVGVGGAYHWVDKYAVGYPVIPDNGAIKGGTYDLSRPAYAPSVETVDLWLSYKRKLTKWVDWKIQFNVRNAFAKDGLIPISVESDGTTWAAVRTKPDRIWSVTNTLSF